LNPVINKLNGYNRPAGMLSLRGLTVGQISRSFASGAQLAPCNAQWPARRDHVHDSPTVPTDGRTPWGRHGCLEGWSCPLRSTFMRRRSKPDNCPILARPSVRTTVGPFNQQTRTRPRSDGCSSAQSVSVTPFNRFLPVQRNFISPSQVQRQ